MDMTVETFQVFGTEAAHHNYLVAKFPVDPDAVRYRARFFGSSAPNLHFVTEWNAFDPVPTAQSMSSLVPGYSDGRIGNTLYIVGAQNGCNYILPAAGCYPGSARLASAQAGLAAIGGQMEITIFYN